jgi:hypothetical protein
MKIRVISFAAAIALVAGAAHAATLVSYAGYGIALNSGETLVTDFSNPAALPTGFSLTGDAAFLTGTSGLGAAPSIGVGLRDAGQYLSVEAHQFEVLATPLLNEVSVYVGSIDTYNTLSFTFKDGTTQSFTGAELAAYVPGVADGNQLSPKANGRFTFDFSDPIDAIRFDSTGNSFEVADVAATLPASNAPEPAVWAMMLAGFATMGHALRRTRKTAHVTAA